MSRKDKIIFIILIAFVLGTLIFGIIKNTEYIKLTKEDLIYVQEQFDYLEELKKSKSTDKFIIHTKTSGEYGFESNITIDEDLFNSIKENDVLDIYYYQSNKKYMQKEIIELYYNGEPIFTLDNYHQDYKRMNITFMIVFASLVLFALILGIVLNNINKIFIDKPLKINYDSKKNLEVYEDFKNRIKYDGYIYTADFDKCFDEPNNIYVLCKLLNDTLEDKEIKIIYDEHAKDEVGYFVFKLNNKIIFSIIFITKDNKYVIDDISISWSYPDYSELTKEEKNIFNNQLEYYCSLNDIEINVIEDK